MANRMVTGTAGKKKMPKAKGHKPKGKVRHMNIEKAENGVKVDTHYLPPEGDESKYVEPSSMVFGDGSRTICRRKAMRASTSSRARWCSATATTRNSPTT